MFITYSSLKIGDWDKEIFITNLGYKEFSSILNMEIDYKIIDCIIVYVEEEDIKSLEKLIYAQYGYCGEYNWNTWFYSCSN